MRRFFGILLLALIPLLFVQAFFFFKKINTLPPSHLTWENAQLCDPDCYMRLVLIKDWLAGHSWYEHNFTQRSNAPYGETSHWTKPVSILLVAGAGVFRLFTDSFDAALFWFGVVFSPLLQVLSIGLILWSIQKYILDKEMPYVILFIVFSFCQPSILGDYLAGRPDHHSLLLLLFIALLGIGFRILNEPYRKLSCVVAGVIAALGIWVSIEFVAPTLVLLTGLGLGWLNREGDYMPKIKKILQSLIIGLTIVLLIEYPRHLLFSVEYDRVSIVYWVFFGLIYLFSLLSELTGKHFAGRLIYSLLGISIILIATQYFFPHFVQGPYSMMDPRAASVWLKFVNEVEPLFSGSNPFSRFFMWIGSVLIAVPFLLYQIKDPTISYRRLWNFLLWNTIIFTALVLYQIRWCSYAQILYLFPLTFFIIAVLPWIERKSQAPWTRPLKVAFILILAVGFPLLGEAVKSPTIKQSDESSLTQSVPVEKLCGYLNQMPKMRILCLLDIAPEILYRTKHEVIGTPYHRNGQGIWDTYAVMTDTGADETARQILQERGITHILIFNDNREAVFYQTENKETLWKRLKDRGVPDFLVEEELPCELSNHFKLFKVK